MAFLEKSKSRTKDITDEELVKKILNSKNKKEQRSLQEDLYSRYIKKVFFKCVSIVKNRETAKDLAHDIMVKMFLNLSKFKGEAPFGSWISSITYNHCINFLRKEKKIRFEDIEDIKEKIADNVEETEEKELLEMKLNQLEQIFQYLSEDEKLILLMRYQDGMPIKLIATKLKIGESAVKMRLKRSRDHLAKLLKEMTNE